MKFKFALLMSAALLSGCATDGRIARSAAQYNEAVEWNTNVVTLMNAVRASKRLPMHYTRLGSMVYSDSVEAGASFRYVFGNDTPEDAPLNLNIGGSEGANVTFEALSNQNFYNAILASISPTTVKFYRDQGWPDSLVMALFIERIEVEEEIFEKLLFPDKPKKKSSDSSICKSKMKTFPTRDFVTCAYSDEDYQTIIRNFDKKPSATGNGKTENQKAEENNKSDILVIDNDPENPLKFDVFRRFTAEVTKNFEIELKKKKSEPYCNDETNRMSDFTEAQCSRLAGHRRLFSLSESKDVDLSVFPDSQRTNFHIENGVVFQKPASVDEVVFTLKDPEFSTRSGDLDYLLNKQTCLGDKPESSESDKECKFRIVLRSPNSALYYLGELLRAQDPNQEIHKKYSDYCGKSEGDELIIGVQNLCSDKKQLVESQDNASEDSSLFYLERKKHRSSRIRSFRHRDELFEFPFQGEHFGVSRNYVLRGKTMQLVTLVNELFSQNQEASTAPSVTILNGVTP